LTPKEYAKEKISQLVERFEEQHESYKKAEYNETLTRRDFIDPFFKALGWDIDNEKGYAESYREVIHEDKVKVGKATKAPDYSFRLVGGKRLFFVEAKKPHVVVKDDIIPAYQVRRYGWSAKLAISIITDFEEFAIYDCTKKPLPADKASVARIKYLTFRDYLKEFDFIWDTFSQERVLKGSFDKFVQGSANKKGTATVDKEFLESLDRWRTYLATSISWNNKNLDEEEINFVVQQTIDRIIFLRIAEDRGVEQYGNLKLAIKQGELYQNLFHQFEQADDKYNSGLFDFKKDQISKTLSVDNKVLKTIINELYYPESPYEFSVLSVEILGSAYEQFLGKQIKVDKAHRAHIEEKPEVRKAGGVYYTPQYIVEYIVKNTVGKLIESKTPKEISNIKIVDPACGSGSFLIGAYQFLLDWHKNHYTDNGKLSKGTKKNPLTPQGNLTTAEKKRILLNNIYGVDIDVNAVEVTKLSLLLKCMEGETEATIENQMKLFNDRVLPTLDNNIKTGNSLIDTDYYDSHLDFGEEKKIRPFNWQKGFPEVFKQGGFDVVIGNPPYVRQELFVGLKNYLETHYKVFHGVADLYSYFFEKGIQLLNEKGIFGIIVSNKWMRANYGEPLRNWVKGQNIKQIIDFGDLPVFQGVSTYPCIFICGKGRTDQTFEAVNVKTLQFESLEKYVFENKVLLQQNIIDKQGWNLSSNAEQELLQKLSDTGISLDEYVNGKIYRGVLTGLNDVFVIDQVTKERLIKEDPSSAEIIKPFLAGRNIKKYQSPKSEKFLIFTKRGINIDKYPAIKGYLQQFKKQLSPKPKDYLGDKWEGRKPGNYKWYEMQDAVEYFREFEKTKIVFAEIATQGQFLLDDKSFYVDTTAYILGINSKYLLGILNSNVTTFYFSKISSSIRGGFFRWKLQYVKTIPIPKNGKHKEEIEVFVDQIMHLNKKLEDVKLDLQLSQLRSKIEYIENKINEMVYLQYELTSTEIAIIQNAK
jgi:type I restriction-modification system DNA methylase subunit